jgi:hypothetical protein
MGNSSCKNDGGHYKIAVKNHSNKSIILVHLAIKDTGLVCSKTQYSIYDKFLWGYEIEIKEDSIYNELFNIYNESWENRIEYSKDAVFFFDKDTFLNYPCDTLNKYKWYKKQELTLDYLNQNNWTITYP